MGLKPILQQTSVDRPYGGGLHRAKTHAGLRRAKVGVVKVGVVGAICAVVLGLGMSPADAAATELAAATAPCASPAPAGRIDPAVLPSGTFAGVTLNSLQVTTASTIVRVGRQMAITRRGIRIAIAVAMQESSLNPAAIRGRYIGLFQQHSDPQATLYTHDNRLDPVGATTMFFQQLVKMAPGYQHDASMDWQIGEVIQQTEVGRNVEQWFSLSEALTARLFILPLITPGALSATSHPQTLAVSNCSPATGGRFTRFDPGLIISDAIFYNTKSMTALNIRTFLNSRGARCTASACLRVLRVNTSSHLADRYCTAYRGSAKEDVAAIIAKVSVACGINPQVMLVTLQKESGLLNRTDVTMKSYADAFGWHCPDSGPGGSPNCDPRFAGFFNQAYGMAKQWARYRLNPGKYNFHAGQTAHILWNIAPSHCGGSNVYIRNMATASLYDYTPYQPNAAALAGYPGVGDKCSAYGNRNFFFLFQRYFGTTGGGKVTA